MFGPGSRKALRSCLSEGRLIACEVVWAEAGSFFPSVDATQEAMGRLGVEYSPVGLETALAASRAWRLYRNRGGQRERVAA
ncbi:MAG: DNA-binding protein, partial [candidate division NC10 bacterium]|nr:DNA-binding protein [candidate division NC10 bacterium]